MKIWLDDCRIPPDGWIWAKNSMEFCSIIRADGRPEKVSFDHDLGDDSHDGSWCASWLINRGLDLNWVPSQWEVHSDNPCGRDNIVSKMRSWDKVWVDSNVPVTC